MEALRRFFFGSRRGGDGSREEVSSRRYTVLSHDDDDEAEQKEAGGSSLDWLSAHQIAPLPLGSKRKLGAGSVVVPSSKRFRPGGASPLSGSPSLHEMHSRTVDVPRSTPTARLYEECVRHLLFGGKEGSSSRDRVGMAVKIAFAMPHDEEITSYVRKLKEAGVRIDEEWKLDPAAVADRSRTATKFAVVLWFFALERDQYSCSYEVAAAIKEIPQRNRGLGADGTRQAVWQYAELEAALAGSNAAEPPTKRNGLALYQGEYANDNEVDESCTNSSGYVSKAVAMRAFDAFAVFTGTSLNDRRGGTRAYVYPDYPGDAFDDPGYFGSTTEVHVEFFGVRHHELAFGVQAKQISEGCRLEPPATYFVGANSLTPEKRNRRADLVNAIRGQRMDQTNLLHFHELLEGFDLTYNDASIYSPSGGPVLEIQLRDQPPVFLLAVNRFDVTQNDPAHTGHLRPVDAPSDRKLVEFTFLPPPTWRTPVPSSAPGIVHVPPPHLNFLFKL